MHVWRSDRSVQLKRKVIFSGLKYILSTSFIRQLQYVRWKDRPYTHANMKSFNFTINFIFLSNVLLVLLSNANIGNSKNEIIKLFKSINHLLFFDCHKTLGFVYLAIQKCQLWLSCSPLVFTNYQFRIPIPEQWLFLSKHSKLQIWLV